MLEKPDFPDGKIRACLQDSYRLLAGEITFLPLGADSRTAVYRAVAADGTPYFVKLRGGDFHEPSVTLPHFLRQQGITPVIAPLPAQTGQLWAELPPYRLIVYPYVPGKNGYEAGLTDGQWIAAGVALRQIHDVQVPLAIRRAIHREAYAPRWRDAIRRHTRLEAAAIVNDPVAVEAYAILQENRAVILELASRAARLAEVLQRHPPQFVVCHADLHAGNFLLTAGGDFYLVDWDEPILAPKERDLMVAGSGLMGNWRSPAEEEALFYQGYGPSPVDRRALAYYRYERIIADIAVFGEELLLSMAGGDDRAQSLRYLQSNFLPDGTIRIAFEEDDSDPILP